jgi:hypothetical protein
MRSNGLEGGNLCDASSENTLEYMQYCRGMLGFSNVCFGLVTILQISILSVCKALGLLICRGKNLACVTSGLRSMTGSWLWSIQPLFQLIRGWKAANHE